MALCIAYISYELMLVRLMISPEVERLRSVAVHRFPC